MIFYNPIKNEQRTCIDIFPKKTYKWPTDNMKRCSISLIVREIQIKTTMKIPGYTCYDGFYQKTRDKCWQWHREKGTFYTVSGNINCAKQYGSSSNTLKVNYRKNQQSYCWVYIQKNWNQYLKGISAQPCSLQHYSEVKIWGKNPKCQSKDEWIKKMCVCVYMCTYTRACTYMYAYLSCVHVCMCV